MREKIVGVNLTKGIVVDNSRVIWLITCHHWVWTLMPSNKQIKQSFIHQGFPKDQFLVLRYIVFFIINKQMMSFWCSSENYSVLFFSICNQYFKTWLYTNKNHIFSNLFVQITGISGPNVVGTCLTSTS